MEFGLSDIVIERINNVFSKEPKIETVIIFGSRAKGNFKPGSDIDFALKGDGITHNDNLNISRMLDELNLPYLIDLINYNSITDKDVVEHIDRVGKVFYRK